MGTISQRTTTAVAWNIAEQFAVRGISVLVTLLLAYFLSPDDFGLLAMMTIFINVASAFMDSGFTQALIRLPQATERDFNTAFFANIVLGLMSYALLFFLAPLVADIYEEERLVSLLRVTGLIVLVNAFQVVQYAQLSRALNFKLQFSAMLPATIVSAVVAVVLAYCGYGVWTLIVQMLVAAVISTALLWYLNGWRPTQGFCVKSFKSMYSFGYKLFLADLLDIVFRNIFVVVIAKLFSITTAGLYFFADRIREFIVLRLVSAIQNVTYPALSTLQNDDHQLKRSYKNLVLVNTYLLTPLILFSAALSYQFFLAFLPSQWLQSSSYLALMCIAGVLTPLSALNLNILKIKGRSDLFLRLEIIKKSMQIGVLIISVNYGVIGILYGQILLSFTGYIINSYYSARFISYSGYEQIRDFMPVLLLSISTAMFIYVLQSYILLTPIITFFLLSLIAISIYVFFSIMIRLRGLHLLMGLLMGRKG